MIFRRSSYETIDMNTTNKGRTRGTTAFTVAVLSTVIASGTLHAQTAAPQSPQQTAPPAAPTAPQTPTQQPVPLGGRQAGATGASDAATSALQTTQLSSAQFFDPSGFTVESLVTTGFGRRADLLAARQRLAIAEGRLLQAGLRPNPTLDAEYGSPRFLGGEAEQDFSVGVSQVFETGGKRRKRTEVARLELAQVRAEVRGLERGFAADIRASFARSIAFARQLDTLERLITANEELVRVTNARLNEGDVAPIDLNLVRLETDRLRAQVITTRAELEGELIGLRALVGFEPAEPLRITPLAERPPRLDLSITELTDIALRERADLQAARLAEEAGTARIRLARSLSTPNVAASVRFSRSKGIIDLPEQLGEGLVGRDTDNELTFGVSVELPVFNRNQGEIASAVGEREQVVRQREFLEASIRRDTALAYRRYRAAAESLVLYATQIVPRAEENVRTIRAAYNLGEFSVFDIVNEQRRLIESETGYNEALGNYYAALAELERALGTTLPPSAFAPESISVLPDKEVFDLAKQHAGAPVSTRKAATVNITASAAVTAPPVEVKSN